MNTPSRFALIRQFALFVLGLTPWIQTCWAQQTTLYDPQPPANSAYVRVIVGGDISSVDVWLNKSMKLSKQPTWAPSSYLVVPAGSHEVTVKSGQKQVSAQIDAKASRSVTVLFPALSPETKPVVIEDRTNGNRLKAIISLYQLGSAEPVDVWTADGSTQIFKATPLGGMAALVVNPIQLSYQITASGTKTPLAAGKLDMSPGGSYSLVVTPGKPGELAVQSYINNVERYSQQ